MVVPTEGGANSAGNIFCVNTNGQNYKSIFSFGDTLGNGPATPLVIVGDTIFGITLYGGKYNTGILYRIEINGSNFKKLMDFSNSPVSILYFNNYLFGVSVNRNIDGTGEIFKIGTNGTGYEVIRGSYLANYNIPNSPLMVKDSVFYGGAGYGTEHSEIFSINPDGSNYKVLFDFQNMKALIANGALVFWKDYLFGTCLGSDNLIKIDLTGNNSGSLFKFEPLYGSYIGENLLLINDCLYGTTLNGGKYGKGVIYKYNLQTKIPTHQPSDLKITNSSCQEMRVTWKKSDSYNNIAFIKEGMATGIPIMDQTDYPANSKIGEIPDINGSGWYCFLNGADSSVILTGIKPATNYQIVVFSYNKALQHDEKYYTTIFGTNSLKYTSPKCQQSINFNYNPIKTYGDQSFILNGAASSGLKINYYIDNKNVAVLHDDTVSIVNAGTANITATQDGNDIYYPADIISRTLTIGKAVLKIIAVDTFKYQDSPNPDFRIDVRGLVNQDSLNDLAKFPVSVTTATLSSLPGFYPILISGGEDENYTFDYIYGHLRVLEKTSGVNTSENQVVKVYPNPVKSKLILDGLPSRSNHIQVVTLKGTILLDMMTDQNYLDTTFLKPGIYIIIINGLKFEIQKL